MNFQKFTEKMQEAVASAQSLAVELQHTEVDSEHLLLALIDQKDGLIARLLSKMGIAEAGLKSQLESELRRKPRITGGGVDPTKVLITHRLSQALVRA